MRNHHKMTIIKTYKFSLMLFSLILFVGAAASAQNTAGDKPELGIAPTIKMSGIAPEVGIEYQLNAESRVRALIFFSGNTGRFQTDALLDLSYLRTLRSTNSLDLYWGANMHLQADEFLFAPGIIAGASYNLDKNVAIFGEAGFNVFFLTESDYVEYGMLNSGVGLRVSL